MWMLYPTSLVMWHPSNPAIMWMQTHMYHPPSQTWCAARPCACVCTTVDSDMPELCEGHSMGKHHRNITINQINQELAPQKSFSLPLIHALTGYDTWQMLGCARTDRHFSVSDIIPRDLRYRVRAYAVHWVLHCTHVQQRLWYWQYEWGLAQDLFLWTRPGCNPTDSGSLFSACQWYLQQASFIQKQAMMAQQVVPSFDKWDWVGFYHVTANPAQTTDGEEGEEAWFPLLCTSILCVTTTSRDIWDQEPYEILAIFTWLLHKPLPRNHFFLHPHCKTVRVLVHYILRLGFVPSPTLHITYIKVGGKI